MRVVTEHSGYCVKQGAFAVAGGRAVEEEGHGVILIAANTNLTTVAKRLGHAQTTTTANIYAHAIRQADEMAAEVLDIALHVGAA